MSLSDEEVRKIARLARIRLEDQEIDHFAREINAILNWVEQLQKVDTDNIKPMAGVGDYTLRLREDAVNDGGITKEVTANAPAAEFDCYVVPKVVE